MNDMGVSLNRLKNGRFVRDIATIDIDISFRPTFRNRFPGEDESRKTPPAALFQQLRNKD